MSETATMDQTILELANKLEGYARLMSLDIRNMPDDMMRSRPAEKARTAYDIIYEVSWLNRSVVDALEGRVDSITVPDGWVTAPAEFQDPKIALEAFETSVKSVADKLRGATPEQLDTVMPTPMGPTPIRAMAGILPVHVMYHSGQLNYIQTLHGDDQIHWAG